MKRIDQIMAHPVYQYQLRCIEEAEQDRIFCKHGLPHALDVARILYIMVLEKSLPFDREVIYAAALLHDIGRGEQYEKQIPHHEAGAFFAEQILADCRFDCKEIQLITEAIQSHQMMAEEAGNSLNGLLYQADKLSRNCFRCKAQEQCYWSQEKRNQDIRY